MKVPDIWVTIGKRGFNEKNLIDLVDSNVDGIRINTGRSTYSWIYKIMQQLNDIGYPMEKILLDVGNSKPRLLLKNKCDIDIKKNEIFIISDEERTDADAVLLSSYFFENINKNDVVYFGDGGIEGIIENIKNHKVMVRLLNDGHLSESVSIGVKGKNLFHFYIAEKEMYEINNLLNFYPVQLILSFVENGENIKWARKQFPMAVSIIPKIETLEAINDIDNILELSDCIFIGRGDLGLSVGIEKIGVLQEILINKAHQAGCRVSLGTDTLSSLKWSEIPLRAEIIDITNSCMRGVDIIALTSETGGSINPFKAIDYLNKILDYLKTVL